MSLKRLEDALNDAMMNVARCAQELSDGAEGIPAKRGAPYENGVTVQKEDMDELRDALKVWKEATNDYLTAVGKEE